MSLEVKSFYTLMGMEVSTPRLHLDSWGLKKLFSCGIRRYSYGSRPIKRRKVPCSSSSFIVFVEFISINVP